MKKLLIPFWLICFVLGLFSMSQAATVIFADNFDADTPGLNKNNFQNWDVSMGSVDLIPVGNSFDFFNPVPGYPGLYVDMDGSIKDAGKIKTKSTVAGLQNLVTGLTYFLGFDLAGNQRNTDVEQVDVGIEHSSLGFIPLGSFGRNQNDFFMSEVIPFSFAQPGDIQLVFEGVGGDDIGLLLDNVTVETPVPPALLLLGSGLIGLVGIRRKLRQ